MVPLEIDLSGKVAALTGGGGVLCGAMSKALAECGARVAVLDLLPENAEKVVAAITATGGTALAVACDVLSTDSLAAANARIEAELGPIDILVNGAGGNHPKGTASLEELKPGDLDATDQTSFYDLDPEGVGFVLNLNYLGTVLASQALSRGMAERGHGNIVNISSMSAFTPLTKVMSYSSAKAGVSNFTQWLAVHLAKMNVRVNAMAPGFFKTAQNQALLENPDGSDTPRGETIRKHTPMGRYGVPDDLIGTLLWLVCDEASGFVTGTVIPIDGGFSAFSGV